jgi:hypothetical protein
MPIKNNDDVAHLLDATGRASSPYREFEPPADQMSAPLIDAVFSKEPPVAAPEVNRPLAMQGGPSAPDLLSEVFEGTLRQAPPTHPYSAPSGPPPQAYPQAFAHPGPTGYSPLLGQGPSAASSPGPKRTLSDIRHVITKRVEEVPSAPPSGGLTGLFDRLAR